jgi:sec-independent protein translocase protein TatB
LVDDHSGWGQGQRRFPVAGSGEANRVLAAAGRSQLAARSWLHYHEPMSLPDLIFIFLLALVIIGPKKMPGLARQLGKFMAEFKRASNEFKNQLETEMMNIELEERAKKPTDSPKVLPPDEPWERLMRPLTDSVSRTRKEFETMASTKPAASEPPPKEQPTLPNKTAGSE